MREGLGWRNPVEVRGSGVCGGVLRVGPHVQHGTARTTARDMFQCTTFGLSFTYLSFLFMSL